MNKSATVVLLASLLVCLAVPSPAQEKAQEKKIKSGLTPED